MAVSWTGDLVRQTFVDFFVNKHDHIFVPSSPVVPNNDPTLQFANSGMNQFKPLFLDQVNPSSHLYNLKRAVNSQKCIRAGGKHNDLDDVGKDTYHHTFFEMLGNWSFGDYFQEEAIDWAFTLLTQVFELPANRLYATYFEGDASENLDPDYEALRIWKKYLPEDHILPGNKRDNFWEMGATGPCGPCSELHYDRLGNRNAAELVNQDDPMVIEIWNLVFMQYDRQPNGQLKKLMSRHVDTGMGFERLLSILQNKYSNYDTDIFQVIFKQIQSITNAPSYEGKIGAEDVTMKDTAYRVVADHIRTLTFAISDGSHPGPVDRGYVLRRILRRAVRYGKQFLNAKSGFLTELIPLIIQIMSNAFPELSQAQAKVIEAISVEEKKFEKSVVAGIAKFQSLTTLLQPGDTMSASSMFLLYNAYGFPEDLTRIMAEERQLNLDFEQFHRLLDEKRQEARRSQLEKQICSNLILNTDGCSQLKNKGIQSTDDMYKYGLEQIEAKVVAIWDGDQFHANWSATLPIGDDLASRNPTAPLIGIILDKTNFYSESGGQLGDHGNLTGTSSYDEQMAINSTCFTVEDVQSFGGYVLHIGRLDQGLISVGMTLSCEIDIDYRHPIMVNHTATHLVNLALREVLGPDINQQGSVVSVEHLRFDFNYSHALQVSQLEKIDQIVSDHIGKGQAIYTEVIPLDLAKRINGIRAMFGEKYPNPVRVVSIGMPIGQLLLEPNSPKWLNYSVELCGGTHIHNVKEIELFTTIEEGTHGSGIHRLIAVTGEVARQVQRTQIYLSTKFQELKNKKNDHELNLAVNSFIYQLENAMVSAQYRTHIRDLLAPIKSKIQQHAIEMNKMAQKTALNYTDEALAKIRADKDLYWVDVISVGSNSEQLGKAAKKIVEEAQALGLNIPVLLMSKDEINPEKPRLVISAVVPDQIIDQKGLIAKDWAKVVAERLGGKAGGKQNVAQGTASKVEDMEDAIQLAKDYAKSKLI